MTDLARVLVLLATAVLLASWLGALFYPIFRARIRAVEVRRRALLTLLYSLASAGVGVAVALASLQPVAVGSLVPAHCHTAYCGPHVPLLNMGSPLTMILTAVALGAVLALSVLLWRNLQQDRRRVLALESLSRHTERFRLMDNSQQLACCAGLLQPSIYLSRGLLARLNDGQLQAVLAHERAHVQRRDNLRRIALRWATVCWPARLRRRLARDFTLNTEQACDAEAALAGYRDRLPEVIRLLQRTESGQPAMAEARVAALAMPADRRGGWADLTVCIAAQFLLLTATLHTVLELLLG